MSKNNQNYDDIIDTKYPFPLKHPQMSLSERAAQFGAFKALEGHEAALEESARVTENRLELSEDDMKILNEKIALIEANLPLKPLVSVTYFKPDAKKSGGAYLTMTGSVRKIDLTQRKLIFSDKTSIDLDSIIDINKN